MCIGCRQRSAKNQLLRLVTGVNADGETAVVFDLAQTAPGRGAYLHPNRECLELAERRHAYARALRYRGRARLMTGGLFAQLKEHAGVVPVTT